MMDNDYRRPTLAALDGDAAGGGGSGGDWRTQLPPESRERIVSKIAETLKRHLPVSGPEGLQEFKKTAVRLEEEIYTAATSQADYLRKIYLKMLTMEMKSPNTNTLPSNSAGSVSKPPDSVSLDSSAQTSHVDGGGWKEEIYQKQQEQQILQTQQLKQQFQQRQMQQQLKQQLLLLQQHQQQQRQQQQAQMSLHDSGEDHALVEELSVGGESEYSSDEDFVDHMDIPPGEDYVLIEATKDMFQGLDLSAS